MCIIRIEIERTTLNEMQNAFLNYSIQNAQGLKSSRRMWEKDTSIFSHNKISLNAILLWFKIEFNESEIKKVSFSLA